MKKRIFTLGLELPGEEFEQVDFSSNRTLLDADIIVMEPTLAPIVFESFQEYNGKPILKESASFEAKASLDHWQSEILAAVKAGKMVVVFLAKPISYFRYTGEKTYSGTGRSRVTTRIVDQISSYEALPNLTNYKEKEGLSIRIEKGADLIAAYWNEFKDYSKYEVEFNAKDLSVMLRSGVGDRVVGGIIRSGAGSLLYLPPLRYQKEKFITNGVGKSSHRMYWTSEGEIFGKRLLATFVSMADNLGKQGQKTAPPVWAGASEYRLQAESILEAKLIECRDKLSKINQEKALIEQELEAAGNLRGLLFEQGKPLEAVVLEAMRLFGFEAHSFNDGKSEFDGVFVSPEGRCLGEVEGRDNKPINIDKFSQLERNIQEDFARDDVTEYAKALLFGNAYRLTHLPERPAFFTDKCVSAAKRTNAALIRTPDMFGPVRYLQENPADADYALACRQAIFSAAGGVVSFPAPPAGESSAVAIYSPFEEGRADDK